MKEKGLLKNFWRNFREYLCFATPLIMTLVTFMNVFSRKISWFNMSFTQELVTTIFVRVCCLAAASVFRTGSHIGFNHLADKFRDAAQRTYHMYRFLPCTANYGIWIIWKIQMVCRQYHYNLLTGVLEMSQWIIEVATPLSTMCSIIRIVQYEIRLIKEGG